MWGRGTWRATSHQGRHPCCFGRNLLHRVRRTVPGRSARLGRRAYHQTHALDHLARHRLTGTAASVSSRTGLSQADIPESAAADHGAGRQSLLRRRASRQDPVVPQRPELRQGRSVSRCVQGARLGQDQARPRRPVRPGLSSPVRQESLLLRLLCSPWQQDRTARRRQPGVAVPCHRHRSAALRSEEREGPHHLAGRRAQRRRLALRQRRLPLHLHRRRGRPGPAGRPEHRPGHQRSAELDSPHRCRSRGRSRREPQEKLRDPGRQSVSSRRPERDPRSGPTAFAIPGA